MSFDIVQFSYMGSTPNSRIPLNAAPETWRTVIDVMDIKYQAQLGRPRVVDITIANPDNSEYNRYSQYQRVRIFSQSGYVPLFLGRIEKLEPVFEKGLLHIICRDYLGDLADRKNILRNVSGNKRSDIVKTIVDGESIGNTRQGGVYRPTNSAKYQQSVQTDLHIEDSIYIGETSRRYGTGSGGYESILESIQQLSREDAWQDIHILYDDGTNTTLLTADIHNGFGVPKPEQVGSTDHKILIGSSRRFEVLRFGVGEPDDGVSDVISANVDIGYSYASTFSSSRGDANEVSSMVSILNGDGTLYSVNGSRNWSALDLKDLEDLVSGSTIKSRPDEGLSPTQISDLLNNLYWIEITVDESFTTERDENASPPVLGLSFGRIYSIDVETGNQVISYGWDYRVEDQEILSMGSNQRSLESYYNYIGVEFLTPSGDDPDNIRVRTSPNDISISRVYNWEGNGNFPRGPEVATQNKYILDVSGTGRAALFSNIQANVTYPMTSPIASLKYFERGSEPWDFVTPRMGSGVPLLKQIGVKAYQSVLGSAHRNNFAKFVWRNSSTDRNTYSIIAYSLGENNFDIVTRVTVVGRNGSVSATATDGDAEDRLGIIKEKTFANNWDLQTVYDCNTRAQSLLSQYASYRSPEGDIGNEGFRHAQISVSQYPLYTNNLGQRKAVREGDVVLLTIRDKTNNLSNAPFLVYSIVYDSQSSLTKIRLSRDYTYNDNEASSKSDNRKADWANAVASERSASQIIWHTNVGDVSAKGRLRYNEHEDDPLQDTIDIDRYVSRGDSDVINDNEWETNMRIMQNAGGAILFRGGRNFVGDEQAADNIVRTALGRFDDLAGGDDRAGALYYNASNTALRASASIQDLLAYERDSDGDLVLRDGDGKISSSGNINQVRALQRVFVGEWGRVHSERAPLISTSGQSTSTNAVAYRSLVDGSSDLVPNGVTVASASAEVLANEDKSYGIILFETPYIGQGSDNNIPPHIIMTVDSSRSLTNTHYSVVIESWIQGEETLDNEIFGTLDGTTYFYGVIVRFVTALLAETHIHRIPISAGGGTDNVQMYADSEGLHGLTSSSSNDVFIQTGETQQINIEENRQITAVDDNVNINATYLVLPPTRNYLFQPIVTGTDRSNERIMRVRQRLPTNEAGYVQYTLNRGSGGAPEFESEFNIRFMDIGYYDDSGTDNYGVYSGIVTTINGEANAHQITGVRLEIKDGRVSPPAALDDIKIYITFASSAARTAFNTFLGTNDNISSISIKASDGSDLAVAPSFSGITLNTDSGSGDTHTWTRTRADFSDAFLLWFYNNAGLPVSLQFSFT